MTARSRGATHVETSITLIGNEAKVAATGPVALLLATKSETSSQLIASPSFLLTFPLNSPFQLPYRKAVILKSINMRQDSTHYSSAAMLLADLKSPNLKNGEKNPVPRSVSTFDSK
ncbi:MAG: hypothetical protein IPP40_07945 [bacterium]|nr:hypothetical protein [bacterium]